MDDSQDVEAQDVEVQINPVAQVVAPVAAIVGTMIVRKIVSSSYEKATGRQAPEARNPQTSWGRAIVWAVVIAATAAAAEVVIYRIVNQIGEQEIPEA